MAVDPECYCHELPVTGVVCLPCANKLPGLPWRGLMERSLSMLQILEHAILFGDTPSRDSPLHQRLTTLIADVETGLTRGTGAPGTK